MLIADVFFEGVEFHVLLLHHLELLLHWYILKRNQFCSFIYLFIYLLKNVENILEMPLYEFYTDKVNNCAR